MKKKQDSSTFFLDHVTKPSPSTNQNYTGVGRGGGSSQTKNPLQEIRKKKGHIHTKQMQKNRKHV